MPLVLHAQHRTAGVGLGANQGHAGGLRVPRLVILESFKMARLCTCVQEKR